MDIFEMNSVDPINPFARGTTSSDSYGSEIHKIVFIPRPISTSKPEASVVDLFVNQWWVLGLADLTGLFALLLSLYAISLRKLGYHAEKIGHSMSPGSNHDRDLGDVNSPSKIGRWINRITIIIILQCTTILLLLMSPWFQGPFWLGIPLQGFSIGSAAVCYAFWIKNPSDE
jgi:hypothetical protein